MPRRKNKAIKTEAFYVDTNIALDYITGRNPEAIFILDSLKGMGAIIISSSFLVMEATDYKKDSIYLGQKAIIGKWEMRKIIRQSYEKNLEEEDFDEVSSWIEALKSKLELELYDFLVDTDTWELAQYISESSNLAAPDVIHLSSAIIAAKGGIENAYGTVIPCKIFISNDGFLKTEAEKIKQQLDISYPNILTLSEIKKKFITEKGR